MTRCVSSNAGFTITEALAAMLFAGIVLPVAVEGLLEASRAGMMAKESRTAAQLGDAKLTELMATETWRDAETEGDFGEDYPGFYWRLDDEGWSEDTMRVVHLTVYFQVKGREHHVTLSTLALESEL